MSCGGEAAESSDDRSVSSEEKDCPSSNLDTSKDSKSGEDSSSESSSESDSDNEEPKTNEELGEVSAEGASAQAEEWGDKESPTNHFNSECVKIEPHCQHCNAENKHNEQVTPRLLSRGQFLLKVDTEGVYECTETGLIFEVNRKVDIKYCVLSWSKYADLVVKPWAVGGPMFDVKCDPACLTSIQFPHSLCLGRHDANMTFRVLHVKNSEASLECIVDHSATHVRWHVSSLSPVGPVIQSEETLYHHGAVILYKVIDQNPSLSFRVYVATNNESYIKDIAKAVKHSSKKFMKIDKPPVCLKLLEHGKKYRLVSEPEADITPEEIEFVDGSLLKLKSYIEVYLEQPMEFKLLLVETDSDEIVWKAKLRECDWVQHDQSQNVSKRSTSGKRRRKVSNTLPEEEVSAKRMKQVDTSDGAKTLLTDDQLITLAGKLGKEWREIGIDNLELDRSDIDDIRKKEENVTICKFRMLKKWQDKELSNATVQNLYNCLKNVSAEVQDVLEGHLVQFVH
ncbi:NACHT, LRR and PYD domains-containing protein 1a-like isoform X1 [Myotis yumanensis]|uniref:NACHT, LRR and PYD domains-containing protein 1a-like isoform X1 n=1 Tax=Myotis yumanensis TaxID=159337 RepID=UPI0038D0B2B7